MKLVVTTRSCDGGSGTGTVFDLHRRGRDRERQSSQSKFEDPSVGSRVTESDLSTDKGS